ncbi:uncharacterized protein LOC121202324 isoform X2 [Betta splendens]|uniref:Uncharacterized protein LOC121202324 isoform X2 n=1 Tax=Betta splendens TaxID=158456 RepID=A0A8M1HG75_BETSP|nr:uncharacterized protein LOC121202324 isoform X2 [Betta splendens]
MSLLGRCSYCRNFIPNCAVLEAPLRALPIPNSDLVLFVDGSASRDPGTGKSQVGYAVCTYTVLKSGALPGHYSAQAAELITLTQASKLAEGKSVTIYTDSRHAFGITHDFGALWKQRKFLKSDGKPILHHDKVADLLDAILLPTAIAVCKCPAHTGGSDPIAAGNASTDVAAKAASWLPLPSLPLLPHLTSQEHRLWLMNGATSSNGVWYGPATLLPCEDESSPDQTSDRIITHHSTRGLGDREGVQEEALELQTVARPLPGPSDDPHSCEGRKESDLDPLHPTDDHPYTPHEKPTRNEET